MLTLIHHSGCYCRVFLNATSMTDLLSGLGIGAYNSFIDDIEKVKMAANESRLAADQALKVTWVLLFILDEHLNVYQKY